MIRKYFKITNAEENHNGFQYVDGLNILDKPFSEVGTCDPGGLYFAKAKYILKFLSFGIYLREITLPTADPDFKMVKDPNGMKLRANKIILGEKRNLAERSTWEYLHSLKAAYSFSDSLVWASQHGFINIINLMVELGAMIKDYDTPMLREASNQGHLEIVKFIVKNGSGRPTRYSEAIQLASEKGHLEIVKFVINSGVNGDITNKRSIETAAKNGYLDIVKFFIEKVRLKPNDSFAIQYACQQGHLEIVKYLLDKGADVQEKHKNCLRLASLNGHVEIIKLLETHKN